VPALYAALDDALATLKKRMGCPSGDAVAGGGIERLADGAAGNRVRLP